MNERNLSIIINNYISRYDEILKSERPSPLWRSAERFKKLADEAIAASEEDFTGKLFKLSEISKNHIDTRFIQPMGSLCDYAEKEPETVRSLLKSFFADDWGNYSVRESKISSFVEGCNELRSKYFPRNIRYFMTPGKALTMLAMYNPDDNFMYQEASARLFAECVGFEENWGIGAEFNYAVYYRMCLELTDCIARNQLLIFTSCKRYDGEEGLHADGNFHLLAYDIIRCNASFKLFEGIKFTKAALEDNKTYQRLQNEAITCFRKYQSFWDNNLKIKKGKALLAKMAVPGAEVSHNKMGEGTIEAFDGEAVSVKFEDEGVKKYNLLQSVTAGFITLNDDGFAAWKEEFSGVLGSRDETLTQMDLVSAELEGLIALLC